MHCSSPVILFEHGLPILVFRDSFKAPGFFIGNAFIEYRNKSVETQTGSAFVDGRAVVELWHFGDRKPVNQYHLRILCSVCLRLRDRIIFLYD